MGKLSKYNIISQYPFLPGQESDPVVETSTVDVSFIRRMLQKRLIPGQPKKIESDIDRIVNLFEGSFSEAPYKEVYEYFMGSDLIIGGNPRDAELVFWNLILTTCQNDFPNAQLESGKNLYNWILTGKAAFILDDYSLAVETSKHDPLVASLHYWHQAVDYLTIMRTVATQEMDSKPGQLVTDIYEATLRDIDRVVVNATDALNAMGSGINTTSDFPQTF